MRAGFAGKSWVWLTAAVVCPDMARHTRPKAIRLASRRTTVVREIRMGTSTPATPHGNRKPDCEHAERNEGETQGQGPEVGGGRGQLIFAPGPGGQ
jgi:hypothetical protein